MKRKQKNYPADVWRWVDRGEPTDCWPFTGRLATKGYGQIMIAGRRLMAHRVAYELVIGPIPDGHVVDHLCRNRRCCNPAHLQPVTSRENTIRGRTLAAANALKTHCPAGHEYTAANTYPGTKRKCRTCASNARRATNFAEGCRGPLATAAADGKTP